MWRSAERGTGAGRACTARATSAYGTAAPADNGRRAARDTGAANTARGINRTAHDTAVANTGTVHSTTPAHDAGGTRTTRGTSSTCAATPAHGASYAGEEKENRLQGVFGDPGSAFAGGSWRGVLYVHQQGVS